MITNMELTVVPDTHESNGTASETDENVTEVTQSASPEPDEGGAGITESAGPVNGSWCGSDIRRKQLHTLYLFLAFMSLGMVVALSGPTFLDLTLILGVDIKQGTVLFTSGSIGYLAGSLIGGIIFDLFNKELTLFGSTLLGGLLTVAIPWCANLPLMAVVSCFRAAALGALDTGGNALIVKIWGKDVGPYMQAVHFAFGFGGIISPLVAAPFLAPVEDSHSVNSSLISSIFNQSGLSNISELTEGFDNVTRNSSGIFNQKPETDVHIPYLIIGLFAALCAFPTLEMYFSSKAEIKKKTESGTPKVVEEIRHIPLTLPLRLTFLIIMGIFYIMYCCVEDTYASFLMTFVVTHLRWSKTKGAQITSLFWISFSVGRLLAIAIAKILTPWKMLALDFFFLDISFLIFYLGVDSSEWFTWVCAVLLSASMASIFPTGMTWIDRRIFKVTGRVASFLLVCTSTGTMANPILVGYLFTEFTPLWFIYLLFIQSLLCSLLFIATSCLVVWVHRKRKESFTKGGNLETSGNEPVKGSNLIQNDTENM